VVDRSQRRCLLARALELVVQAEQIDRGASPDTEVDRSGRAASAVALSGALPKAGAALGAATPGQREGERAESKFDISRPPRPHPGWLLPTSAPLWRGFFCCVRRGGAAVNSCAAWRRPERGILSWARSPTGSEVVGFGSSRFRGSAKAGSQAFPDRTNAVAADFIPVGSGKWRRLDFRVDHPRPPGARATRWRSTDGQGPRDEARRSPRGLG
jgi:hypothetical protein